MSSVVSLGMPARGVPAPGQDSNTRQRQPPTARWHEQTFAERTPQPAGTCVRFTTMADDRLQHADATALAERVRRGDVHPTELVESAIAAIEKVNPQLNAVVHKMYDQ